VRTSDLALNVDFYCMNFRIC